MKYILGVILATIVAILSYIIMLPYLLMSFRFKAHAKATQDACLELLGWIEN